MMCNVKVDYFVTFKKNKKFDLVWLVNLIFVSLHLTKSLAVIKRNVIFLLSQINLIEVICQINSRIVS
jgi:hypothetical protein